MFYRLMYLRMDILFILATIMHYAFPSLHSMNYAYVVILYIYVVCFFE